MKLILPFILSLSFVFHAACQHQPSNLTETKEPKVQETKERQVGGPCECCEAWLEGVPEELSGHYQISPPGEPGEALEITGTIFKPDGKTPAKDIILYVYHTDAEGNYSNGPTNSKCAERHGHLRGWVKTGQDGRYSFKTIRPASYPGTTIEQHIHPIIKEPGLSAYWIDEILFDDDPNLTAQVRKRQQGRGGNAIITLHRNNEGTWLGQKDIVLGKNVEGY